MEGKYWDIVTRQLAGKASASELQKLEDWLAESPEHKADYQAQKRLWQLTPPSEIADTDVEAAWKKVKSQLVDKQPAKVISIYQNVWRVAASIILLIGVLWLAKYFLFPHFGMEVVESGNRRIAVVLPDNSQVWLNKGSKLIYDKDFDRNERNVQLEGEAFFEVKRDVERPFIIHSNEAQTKVLGTSFNLRAYPDEPLVELAVATGKVAFSLKEQKKEVIVTPGFAVQLNTLSNELRKEEIPGENAWAWKTGKLQFANEELKNILPVLERYYDTEIELKNSALGTCRFTGTFQQADLEEVLQVLTATMQLKYIEQDKQGYSLTGQGCK
ncbi:FecR family protein [Pontibacter cellulosilyticus]|uniref:FecR domain-containing protein n=1 Tax=Pontibacter cellulosilyticus TaxID=1720253 RepID=A0A923N842_9BACT|nr:FecR domain-containing protein [Pontibacter cellulosilyticus]MBC5993522.1 FecR domain-containing protein [Pontibacter cellulosilyticus]